MSETSDSGTIMLTEDGQPSHSMAHDPFVVLSNIEHSESQSIDVNPAPYGLLGEATATVTHSMKGDEVDTLYPLIETSDHKAEYATKSDGSIISEDIRLCNDGDALHRFLVTHTSSRPSILLQCKGSHEEWRIRKVTRYENGKNITSTETYSETITDFDFTIDASDAIIPSSSNIWLAGDRDATYRGRERLEINSAPIAATNVEGHMVLVDLEAGADGTGTKRSNWNRKATKFEREASSAWRKRREDWGYAPWAPIRGTIRGTEACVESPEVRHQLQYSANPSSLLNDMSDDSDILLPSKTLRDWTNEYCSSQKLGKAFTFRKVVYGWNLDVLRQAVENTIRANYPHGGEPTVSVRLEASTITVRSSNWYTWIVSNYWILGILWVTMIYPFYIWPYKQFIRGGSGEWQVAGSAFALTKWKHLTDSVPGETTDGYRQRTSPILVDAGPSAPTAPLKATAKGIAELVGESENQWFARWEATIAGFVKQRYVSSVAITKPLKLFRSSSVSVVSGQT
ncbi:hypothetical protein FRB94_014170 [Tulasnella sp. JGI-2019a]|nr:hypothetical protein FRB94_014170 [Tulasnella sp. JGI-2019a]